MLGGGAVRCLRPLETMAIAIPKTFRQDDVNSGRFLFYRAETPIRRFPRKGKTEWKSDAIWISCQPASCVAVGEAAAQAVIAARVRDGQEAKFRDAARNYMELARKNEYR
jgi:hypothetical protein